MLRMRYSLPSLYAARTLEEFHSSNLGSCSNGGLIMSESKKQIDSSTEKTTLAAIISCGCKFFMVSFEIQENIDFFNEAQFKCPRCLRVLKVELDDDMEDQDK